MKYTFVDIGCGNCDVSTDEFGLNVRGLLVEPIKEYCDILPRSDTVLIENSAISDKTGSVNLNAMVSHTIQYVPTSIINDDIKRERYIKKYGLVLGTSSVCKNPNNSSNVRTVNSLTLDDLFKKYDITEIEQLKIDVEGMEYTILTQLLVLLKEQKIKITKKLIFEYNVLSDLKELDSIIPDLAEELNFSWKYQEIGWNQDIVMIAKV